MSDSYESAGVSLAAGYEVVSRIKKHVASTKRPGVTGGIGSFGGAFDLAALGVEDPILVAGTDGVGTKLKIAFEMDKHDTIGIDCVAMCVNDVLAQGAEPIYFLDYIAQGHNDPAKVEAIIAGIAEGCRQSNCALIGGETAEMPGMYGGGEYDIAGFTTGIVSRSKVIDGTKVAVGDVLVGIESSGLHSNGFSLVRKIITDAGLNLHNVYEELDSSKTLGEVLLVPTNIYVAEVLDVINNIEVHGIAHITGGGFDENLPRILQSNQGACIAKNSFVTPNIFSFMREHGKIPHREMFSIFNMGIGMVLAVSVDDADKVQDILAGYGRKSYLIGKVIAEEGVVIV
ncbi:MAG TPA: phosphoribosylformylglycinamidine cyclo-ligase [Bacillota bacterium]|nr:phosphoribosylformylglycinamidine cyclo-ligase [Bacillota bacterium]